MQIVNEQPQSTITIDDFCRTIRNGIVVCIVGDKMSVLTSAYKTKYKFFNFTHDGFGLEFERLADILEKVLREGAKLHFFGTADEFAEAITKNKWQL